MERADCFPFPPYEQQPISEKSIKVSLLAAEHLKLVCSCRREDSHTLMWQPPRKISMAAQKKEPPQSWRHRS